MECIKQDRDLFFQRVSSKISGMAEKRSIQEDMETYVWKIWWDTRDWLEFLQHRRGNDKIPAWRGKKPERIRLIEPKSGRNEVWLQIKTVFHCPVRWPEQTRMISSSSERRLYHSDWQCPVLHEACVWIKGMILKKWDCFSKNLDGYLTSEPVVKRRLKRKIKSIPQNDGWLSGPTHGWIGSGDYWSVGLKK